MAMSQATAKATRAVARRFIPLVHARGLTIAAQKVATAAPAAALSTRAAALARPVASRAVDTTQPSFDVLAMSCMKPHPLKEGQGEDACFIQNGSDWVVTGIADGVGGWSLEGIDAGEFARELMDRAAVAASEPRLRMQPAQLLNRAHSEIRQETRGSCTACIVVFEGNKLRYANLGDSGLLGYRPHSSTVFIRTKEQQHRWNCPFQLGSESSDRASQADVGERSVQHNDIVVLGTDGFFDNLYDADIVRLISQFIEADLLRRNWPKTEEQLRAAATLELDMAALKVTTGSTAVASSNSATVDGAQTISMMEKAQHVAASLSLPSSPRTPSPIPFTTTPSPPSPAIGAAAPAPAAGTSAPLPVDSRSVHTLSPESLRHLADHLVNQALTKANDQKARTPFSDGAKKAGKRFKGGKLDDITVVVVQVKQNSDAAAASP